MPDFLAVWRPRGRSTASPCERAVGSRRGFSLGEILVVVAIIAVIAAAIVPTVFGRLQAARADAVIGEMQSLESGIMLFYRDVGRYPRRLDYLNTLASGDLDACGAAIPSVNVAKFRGPYISRSITLLNPPTITKYLMSTGDSVESVLTRTNITTATGTQRVLQISVNGLDASTLDLIDYKVDGAQNIDAGKIIISSGTILKWTIPIKSAAC